MKYLISGAYGFIGSHFTELVGDHDHEILVLDKLSYASNIKNIDDELISNFTFKQVDLADKEALQKAVKGFDPDIVVHFASETHVDNSIDNPEPFIYSDIIGTFNLLEVCRKQFNPKKIVHVSTDEVYGDIHEGYFKEKAPIKPSSPYSAAKASADCLAMSYMRTYDMPIIIVRPCNAFGPRQFPEKLIPITIDRAKKGFKVPVYDKGENSREWIYVTELTKWIYRIIKKGEIKQIYNLSSNVERTNLEIIKEIYQIMEKEPRISFVKDRPGHDWRYAMDSEKARYVTDFNPDANLHNQLKNTIDWYLKNPKYFK